MKNNTSRALGKMQQTLSSASFETQQPNRLRPQFKQSNMFGKPNVIINHQGIKQGEYVNKDLSKVNI